MFFIHKIVFNHKNHTDKKQYTDNSGTNDAYIELQIGSGFNESHKNTKKLKMSRQIRPNRSYLSQKREK
ncbi:hypothetical protein AAW06_18280 [Escherichia coli]|nr:hypothetical protein AAW06_18280 [Escherichia coli]